MKTPTPSNGSALLDVRGAALYLGLSPKALRRHLERGRVPYRRLGRKIVFVRTEIKAWLDGLPGLNLEAIREMEERTR